MKITIRRRTDRGRTQDAGARARQSSGGPETRRKNHVDNKRGPTVKAGGSPRSFVLPEEVRLANLLESSEPSTASEHSLRLEVSRLREELRRRDRAEVVRAHRRARLEDVTIHVRDNVATFRRKFRAVTYRPAPTALFVIAPEPKGGLRK